ncbi:PREDICTED: DNA repair and recombination protein RAD54-like, partial [Acropora digitifera]|uniref:DNA repair and recombination protein RAD54-like n=1 Tax=Acropora digitifera TaxID=70779 RepID=UPI00077AFF02
SSSFQRRSLAPSQVLKRKKGFDEEEEFGSRRKQKFRNGSQGEDHSILVTRPILAPLSTQMNTTCSTSFSVHEALIRKILAKPFKVPIPNYQGSTYSRGLGIKRKGPRRALHDPYEEDALVLHSPPELSAHEKLTVDLKIIIQLMIYGLMLVDFSLSLVTLWDTVSNTSLKSKDNTHKGLGKTLQCITLLWTLVRQGPDGQPIANKVIIVAPSSLVKNWYKELQKWLSGRISALAIDSGSKKEIDKKLEMFMSQQGKRITNPVLIISYETFRLHASVLHSGPVGLVICDEGHRLKNLESQTYLALDKLKTTKRILLSGTPIQNDLLEYFSLVHFVNGGILGSVSEFKKKFENPILRGRDADASDADHKRGTEKLVEVNNLQEFCVVDKEEDVERHFSVGELKDLFRLNEDTLSDTHDKFKCRRCVNNIQVHPPPDGTDCSADLSQWNHCADRKGLDDILLKGAWSSGVSFVFHQKSHDKKLGL